MGRQRLRRAQTRVDHQPLERPRQRHGEAAEHGRARGVHVADSHEDEPDKQGKHDGVPEQAFYLQGTIEEVLENAKTMKA